MANSFDDRCRRIAGLDGDTDDQASTRLDDVPADDGVLRPVVAFHEDVRLESRNQLMRRRLVEDDHTIDRLQRLEDFDPFGLWGDRASRAFVCPHGSIGIDADDERVAEGAGVLEVAHVAGMEQVEDAVGEHDLLARSLELFGEANGLVDRHVFVLTDREEGPPGLNLTLDENVHVCFGR